MKIYLLRVKQEKPAAGGEAAYPKYRWKWQIVHKNSTVMATSQLYNNRQTAEKSLKRVREEMVGAPVETIMEV